MCNVYWCCVKSENNLNYLSMMFFFIIQITTLYCLYEKVLILMSQSFTLQKKGIKIKWCHTSCVERVLHCIHIPNANIKANEREWKAQSTIMNFILKLKCFANIYIHTRFSIMHMKNADVSMVFYGFFAHVVQRV